LMEECVDGEYQNFKSKNGAYIREKFFGRYSETAAMVADWSDDKIWRLTRGGHDPSKVYAAYKAAVEHKDQPTCILAKTVKGYGMGPAGEGTMLAHQSKKMDIDALKQFRDRFRVPVADQQLQDIPFIRLAEGSVEAEYLQKTRQALGGPLPSRRRKSDTLPVPPLSLLAPQLKGSDGREISTTMAFVRILTLLMRDKDMGRRVVPIVPDESRTFGMEGMFRQFGIFSQAGQSCTSRRMPTS
jgi:pyruvate dehydrogenase E1 component